MSYSRQQYYPQQENSQQIQNYPQDNQYMQGLLQNQQQKYDQYQLHLHQQQQYQNTQPYDYGNQRQPDISNDHTLQNSYQQYLNQRTTQPYSTQLYNQPQQYGMYPQQQITPPYENNLQQQNMPYQTSPRVQPAQSSYRNQSDFQNDLPQNREDQLLIEKLNDLQLDLEEKELELQQFRVQLEGDNIELQKMIKIDHKQYLDMELIRNQLQKGFDHTKQQHEAKVKDCQILQLRLNELEGNKEALNAQAYHLRSSLQGDAISRQQLIKKDQHIKVLELRVKDMELNLKQVKADNKYNRGQNL